MADWLDAVLDRGELPDLETARTAMTPPPIVAPTLAIPAPDLRAYDELFTASMRVAA